MHDHHNQIADLDASIADARLTEIETDFIDGIAGLEAEVHEFFQGQILVLVDHRERWLERLRTDADRARHNLSQRKAALTEGRRQGLTFQEVRRRRAPLV